MAINKQEQEDYEKVKSLMERYKTSNETYHSLLINTLKDWKTTIYEWKRTVFLSMVLIGIYFILGILLGINIGVGLR